jgi:serine/threonine-protein kinase
VTTHLAALLQDALGPAYRLEQELESGGMSRLFLATDVRLDRRVVVKVLSPELGSAADVARFKREIDLTVRLQHPHILPILTSGSWADGLYYIAPFIPGESLRARIDRDKRLPLDEILRILEDVSDALAFAHQRSIVHRDVKPGNILLADGNAILADFGIARAVSTTATPLTGSGMTPGTPAYMAPELPTDERADVYSLGVVAYEMLCGGLPGRAVTPRRILATRGNLPGDSGRRLRALARLINATLSPSPANRVQGAQEFRDRLARVTNARHFIAPALATGLIAIMITGIAASVALRRDNGRLVENRYLVLPVGALDSVRSDAVQRVKDALGEWQGVDVADVGALAPGNDTGARSPGRLREAMAAARALHARFLITIDAGKLEDSVIVRASLYDLGADTSARLRRAAFGVPVDATERRFALRQLVNTLLRTGDQLPWSRPTDRWPASLAAWRAYDSARAALAGWNLAEAEQSLRSAITADPDNAPVHLWLAQILRWNPSIPRSELSATARRAWDLRTRLAPIDTLRALGLLAMADQRYADACTAFRQIVARDSSDFAAWLDAGECQAQNHVVIRDAHTPTGWRFQSSYESAARAYQRAGEIGPVDPESAFHGWLLGRLSRVLYSVANTLRLGYMTRPDTLRFAALPFLDHDTLAFAPFEARFLATGKFNPPAEAIRAAVERNRVLLRRAAEDWVSRAPRSSAAYDSLAGWIELSGGMGTIAGRPVSALDAVHRARALSRDSLEQLRLGISEVRLLVKASRFVDARAKAESLFAAGAKPHNMEVSGIAGLAALLGHAADAAELSSNSVGDHRIQLPSGALVQLPAQMAEAADRLLAYAALGVVPDIVDTAAGRAMQLAESYYSRQTAHAVQGTVVGVALTFAYPAGAGVMRRIDAPLDEVVRAFHFLALGDSVEARRSAGRLRQMARSTSQAASIDATLRLARLAALLGDTTEAIQTLDPVLRALPTLEPGLLSQVRQAASLVRAFALRAELAAARGDTATAAQCAKVVSILWATADAPLRPVVERMMQLAATR